MSLAELGAIGEFLGAIIIAVSLVFLALQSRQNNKLLQSSGFHARAASLIDLYKSLALSPQFSELTARAESGNELNATERQQLRYLNLAYFRQIENVHFQLELGIFDGDIQQRLEAVKLQMQTSKPFRDDYEWSRNQYRKEFTELMDVFLGEAKRSSASNS